MTLSDIFFFFYILFVYLPSFILLRRWSCNKETGKKKRQPVITAPSLNGGQQCPSIEEQDCPADCEGVWACWGECTTPNFQQPPWRKSRDFTITVTAKNNGIACPTRQTKPCLPDVCYSGESDADSFGVKMMDLVPFRHLPPKHPSYARSTCGGPLVCQIFSISQSSHKFFSQICGAVHD